MYIIYNGQKVRTTQMSIKGWTDKQNGVDTCVQKKVFIWQLYKNI